MRILPHLLLRNNHADFNENHANVSNFLRVVLTSILIFYRIPSRSTGRHSVPKKDKSKRAALRATLFSNLPGDVLLSQGEIPQLPSALKS
ncbi:hypothetical protein, partial [Rossellomorea sp. SC111]|uniref:hypothetical protein n=1 Tax=Rossellomorea sp. SC111 TaxID=2968985 RepID=UPI00215AE7E1